MARKVTAVAHDEVEKELKSMKRGGAALVGDDGMTTDLLNDGGEMVL